MTAGQRIDAADALCQQLARERSRALGNLMVDFLAETTGRPANRSVIFRSPSPWMYS